MTCIASRLTVMPAIAAAMILATCAASAQEARRFAFLDRIFGDSERVAPSAPRQGGAQQPVQDGRVAQASPSELTMRINRLEAQIRQLTGVIEQLQYRNQQLEVQLRSVLAGATPQASPRAAPQASPGSVPSQPPAQPATPMSAPPPIAAAPGGRRADVFDPSQHPGAPGAPRVLGSIPPGTAPAAPDFDPSDPVGAPGGRDAGAPLDLSTMASAVPGQVTPPPAGGATPSEQLPPPPPRTLSGTGAQVATLPPTDNPKDNYDLAYGYVLRKDYALAESRFRDFLHRFPGDRLASDAHYWLGESLFQRQRYRDAAESFLNVSTKFGTSAKAPDALLRLGQALAALGEKDAACASLAEVLRKYPRASVGVRQGVDREQKRVRC
jgi:tol-pal system protein YbgF